jgi:hemophore-related protein
LATSGDIHDRNKSKEYDMSMSTLMVRRTAAGMLAAVAGAGAVAAAAFTAPSAGAAPAPCTASAFANTASSVLGAAGQYLDAHPDANQALTDAGSQGEQAEGSLRSYFTSHPQQFLDLKGIARPLTDQKSQCNSTVSPAQLSALLNALS